MARKRTKPAFFPPEEFAGRVRRVREAMAGRGLDCALVTSPENIYYLTGLDHQGYFAYQALVLPLEGELCLISRAMEKAVVRDQIPDLRHVGYSDGVAPLPEPTHGDDIVLSTTADSGAPAGLRPWEMSAGVPVEGPITASDDVKVDATAKLLRELGYERGRIGIELRGSFFPIGIAKGVTDALPGAHWLDLSGVVEGCRLVQSPRELECTRKAAEISDAMMLSAIAAAGHGVPESDVMAAIYDAMFRRGGTYPGFVPLVRSTRTIEHEHGTWQEDHLRRGDLLFLEMAGCSRRYHAPIGRLVFLGKEPKGAHRMNTVALEAMERAAAAIGPGLRARDTYRAWQSRLDEAGLSWYRRHHCGYAVGIGYPPSWSGSGTPQGIKESSELVFEPGMVFHLMSWLLRTGKGDSFLSDTIVVTENGCEFLTRVSRAVTTR